MVPPLRERLDDIPVLCQFFLNQSAMKLQTEVKTLSEEVIEFFKSLYWQGNVRQLENICHWLTVMAAGKKIQISDLPNDLKDNISGANVTNSIDWRSGLTKEIYQDLMQGKENIYSNFIQQTEKILLVQALKVSNNRKIDAAERLGIGRNTVTRKIKELSL